MNPCLDRRFANIAFSMNWSTGSLPADEEEGPDDARLDALLVEAKQGCNSALGRLLLASQRYLLVIAQQRLSVDLQVKVSPSDLVQDTLLEAIRDFAHFEGCRYVEMRRWLRKILLNNAANSARYYEGTQKRQASREVQFGSRLDSVDGVAANQPTPSKEAIALERELALEHAMERLPLAMRTAILLRNREHLSFAEVGLRMNRSTEAARKLWARGIERLQRELQGRA